MKNIITKISLQTMVGKIYFFTSKILINLNLQRTFRYKNLLNVIDYTRKSLMNTFLHRITKIKNKLENIVRNKNKPRNNKHKHFNDYNEPKNFHILPLNFADINKLQRTKPHTPYLRKYNTRNGRTFILETF